MIFRWLVCATVALVLASFAHADEPPPRAAKLTERERLIEDVLDRKVSLDVVETEFAEVVRNLSKQVEFSITLDPEGLEEAGVTKDQLVTLKLPEMKLRSVLKVLLRPLHLDVIPTRTELLVTSQERASEKLFIRVYPVQDLIEQRIGPDGERLEDFDRLIQIITSLIACDRWNDNGGKGTIASYPSYCLVIGQTRNVHEKIDRLLTSWREINRQAATGKSPAQISLDSTIHAIETKLAAKLANSVDMEFGEYVTELAEKLQLPLVLDPEGLEEAGVTLDQNIKLDLREGTARDVLEAMLEPLHLALVAMPEHALITSEEKSHELYAERVRLYPVGDLIGKSEPKQFDQPWGTGSLGGWDDTLIELITTTVEPYHWTDNGGQAAICVSDKDRILMATCSDKAHGEIELVLARLREEGTEDVIAEAAKKSDTEFVERTYHLYRARRAMVAKSKEKETIVMKEADKKDGQQTAAPVPGGAIGVSGLWYLGAEMPREPIAGPIPSADEVAELIKEMLDDIDWSEKGTKLKPFHDVLIVRHRRAELKKIEHFLDKIDAVPEVYPPIGIGGGGGSGPPVTRMPVVGEQRIDSGGFFSVKRTPLSRILPFRTRQD